MPRKISGLLVKLPTASWSHCVLPCLLFTAFCCGSSLHEESAHSLTLYAQSSEANFTQVDSSKGKLPYYYGQLDLTEEQEKKLRGLSLYHRTEINKYKELMKRQVERRDEECEAVLTVAQKRKLKQVKKQAALKRKKSKSQKKKK